MQPSKVYILKIDNDISNEYAKQCADSCDKVGHDWEYYDGLNNTENKFSAETMNNWLKDRNVELKHSLNLKRGGGGATAGHIALWQKIYDEKDCAIILEHDALMLTKAELDIPDDMIVNLGYKVKDPQNYKHDGTQPKAIQDRKYHGGAHAYAITWKTAETLLEFLKTTKNIGYIDNAYFLSNRARNGVKMGIMDPIAALGWVRESTIWRQTGAVDNYGPMLKSFINNYDSKEDLKVKNKK
jgi:GR25 family glycosyltransferase involved in LPS biosynthesis